MAKENVKKFYKELAENKALQEKLLKAQESYGGDINDRQAVVEEILLPIAKEAGCDFTAEEVKAAERELAEENGISEEELENVSGGAGFCLLVGGCTDISAEAGRKKSASGDRVISFHACVYFGLGMGVW